MHARVLLCVCVLCFRLLGGRHPTHHRVCHMSHPHRSVPIPSHLARDRDHWQTSHLDFWPNVLSWPRPYLSDSGRYILQLLANVLLTGLPLGTSTTLLLMHPPEPHIPLVSTRTKLLLLLFLLLLVGIAFIPSALWGVYCPLAIITVIVMAGFQAVEYVVLYGRVLGVRDGDFDKLFCRNVEVK